MGMYTECRGILKVNLGDKSLFEAKQLIKSYNNSPRGNQCAFSCTIENGFDGTTYIFIGGQIKDYDNDWEQFAKFLENNFNIEEGEIKTRYEEEIEFSILRSY